MWNRIEIRVKSTCQSHTAHLSQTIQDPLLLYIRIVHMYLNLVENLTQVLNDSKEREYD